MADETCYQSGVSISATLQDGGHWNLTRPDTAQGLDSESGSEGCILHYSNSPISPTISKVYGRQGSMPVYLCSIRPLVWPMEFQVMKLVMTVVKSQGIRIIIYIDDILILESNSASGSGGVSPRGLGLHCQSGEILLGPSTGAGVFGNVGGLAKSPTQVARQENKEYLQGGSPALNQRDSGSLSDFSVLREAQCSLPGTVHCSVLQGSASRSAESLFPGYPKLQPALGKCLWLWALERDIVLTDPRCPMYVVAHHEFRLERDRSDQMLDLGIFLRINCDWIWENQPYCHFYCFDKCQCEKFTVL